MAYSLNKLQIIGNIGRDISVRSMTNGEKVGNFSVALNENYTSKTGDKVDKTEWVSVSIFGTKIIDALEKYLVKGTKIYCEGKLSSRTYTDPKTNLEKNISELVINNFNGQIILLDSKNSQSSEDQPQSAPRQQAPQSNQSTNNSGFGGFESPF